jgi:hypothetical protein
MFGAVIRRRRVEVGTAWGYSSGIFSMRASALKPTARPAGDPAGRCRPLEQLPDQSGEHGAGIKFKALTTAMAANAVRPFGARIHQKIELSACVEDRRRAAARTARRARQRKNGGEAPPFNRAIARAAATGRGPGR